MVGDWLVTVTLSCSVATSSLPLIVIVAPALRLTPSTLSVVKPGSVERHGVRAAGQQREAIDALFVGDGGARAANQVVAGDRNRHARQRAAAGVNRPSGNASSLLLRQAGSTMPHH